MEIIAIWIAIPIIFLSIAFITVKFESFLDKLLKGKR